MRLQCGVSLWVVYYVWQFHFISWYCLYIFPSFLEYSFWHRKRTFCNIFYVIKSEISVKIYFSCWKFKLYLFSLSYPKNILFPMSNHILSTLINAVLGLLSQISTREINLYSIKSKGLNTYKTHYVWLWSILNSLCSLSFAFNLIMMLES